MNAPPPLRRKIEVAIDALIDLLDRIDGDRDLEPEAVDHCPDDIGEPEAVSA